MRFRSDLARPRVAGFFALTFVALFAVASPVLSALVTTNIYVVSVDEPVNEDVYVTSTKGVVDGTINGDLTIFTGDLIINGSVTGSVNVFSSGTVTVSQDGTVGGSLRGAAVNVKIFGEVGSDLFITAASIVVEESGTIGRDAMAFGGVLRVEGTVVRDVRGRTVRTVIDGDVGGDIDIATQKFEVGDTASVGGDIQYRSQVDASISSGAQISGTVKRLPTQSNFIYGVILALANIIGFLGFIVVGVVALFVARGSGSRAAGAVITNPIKTLLWGLGAVIALPVVTVLLAATLVGLPIALLLVMVMVAGLIIGPVPAITALGNRILFKRGGLL
jgi:cytoskeletal protein CcmA (bactofilin family)